MIIKGSDEMLLLNVPYEEKEEAKKLGAKWNPEIKKWYVTNPKTYGNFLKWIEGGEVSYILCDELYLVEGKTQCYCCKQQIPVIGYGIKKMVTLYEDDIEFIDGTIHIGSIIDPIPETLLKYIQKHYNYKMRYSKTIGDKYLANGCPNCDSLQGNFFLFQEVDSPFFIDSDETASNLTLYKIKLPYDLVLRNVEVGYGSEDDRIEKCAKIISLDIRL